MKRNPGPVDGPPEEPGADPNSAARTTRTGSGAGAEQHVVRETPAERRRRRAVFLRELAEARELRARVQPRKTKERRMREALRMRTFRI
ncbi:hypothetical protein OG455_21015 [Kitasatospora sp. NBC_01287]|uniref:hypothetical protein n=1 Tax=Kitasatospora sp. NBC_01287 TaxID=2903573 RepID=UPI00224EC712|nr:hypothetical protein [Kitasatospora sp. NBC_01287]MCX4747964.1 hypothetical protein [Kitasatospora sp. NBC_01287]